MEQKRIRILNVEDEEIDHQALIRAVDDKGLPYDVDWAENLAVAGKLLTDNIYDIVLLDYMMPDGTGLDLLDKIRELPSIFITGSGNETVAVKAMKGGVYDYLLKDTAGMYLELLPSVIEKALNNFRMHEEKIRAENELRNRLDEMERLNSLLLQREFRIRELKEENEMLKSKIQEMERKFKIQNS